MTTKQFVLTLTALFLLLLTPFLSTKAHADSKFRAIGEGGEIVILTDEPCAFKDVVSNLKYRAIWKEKDKTFEGCWNLTPFGIIVLYMSDKTVFVIPAQMFERVAST